MQNTLPPDESINRFVTPEGFKVELFAAEPDIQGKTDLHELGRARAVVDL
jgi:hypothetical protein